MTSFFKLFDHVTIFTTVKFRSPRGSSVCCERRNSSVTLTSLFFVTNMNLKMLLPWKDFRTDTHLKSSILWDITPCNPAKVNRHLGGTYLLHFQGWRVSKLVSCLTYSSALKMEAKFLRNVADFHQTNRCYIAEDRTPYIHDCGNLHLTWFWR
jgi:hypothetical protein